MDEIDVKSGILRGHSRFSIGRVKTPKGPHHQLRTANQGVQYTKGVHGLPNDRRLPTTVMFKIPKS
eukprot:2679156-Pyramimonas_sp.AAC.2